MDAISKLMMDMDALMGAVGMKRAAFKGKIGCVPKYALPEENWSEDLLVAQKVISTPSRLAIVGYLYTHGPTLRATLIEDLSLDSSLVGRNLDQLEELGILIGDPPQGERRGRSTRWEVDSAKYKRMAQALYQFLGIKMESVSGNDDTLPGQ